MHIYYMIFVIKAQKFGTVTSYLYRIRYILVVQVNRSSRGACLLIE